MTKKDKNLEEMLEDITNNDASPQDWSSTKEEELLLQIASLTRKVEDSEQIAKRAQSDYLRLKMDMDALITRTAEQQKSAKIDALVEAAKKILPFVTQLKQSLEAAGADIKETPWAQGIQLIYQKMIGSLEQLHIGPITVKEWQDPDLQQHIPVSTQPVEKKKLSGKIIAQIEQWYSYKKDWIEVVIIPAKVVVGQ